MNSGNRIKSVGEKKRCQDFSSANKHIISKLRARRESLKKKRISTFPSDNFVA